ncbi:hypothetical protein L1987_18992 [Smallanthus sonchifolius]|uniref:Uncharacterized protein n=1 Tax=Smallanthus sonchifolius TaxID=185202 RepID=A0ACB9J4R0_9ASTR|nr:hypothetical protein L1987_18992 [Smallanthus sonchifolius]
MNKNESVDANNYQKRCRIDGDRLKQVPAVNDLFYGDSCCHSDRLEGLIRFCGVRIAKLLSERQPGYLPRNTESNPKGNVSAITLRNSKVYPKPPLPEEEEVQTPRREIFTRIPLRPPIAESTTQESSPKMIPQPTPTDTPQNVPTKRTFKSHIPYPGRLVKQMTDEQYEKFIDLLSQIHDNLPFLDIIQQMPKYGRFMKDFLTNKRNMEEAVKKNNQRVALIERCLPKKLSDPEKFSLPCSIRPLPIIFALTDLGASVNVMPYNIPKAQNWKSFIDTNLDYQLKKAKEFNKGMKLDLGKDLDNTN